jgi:hypothetical protein
MIEVINKRIAYCHADGSPSAKNCGVVQEMCIQHNQNGIRLIVRDSDRDGSLVAFFGNWRDTRQEAIADTPTWF